MRYKLLKEDIQKGTFYVPYDSDNEIYKLDRVHQYYFQVQFQIYSFKGEFCVDRNFKFITDMLNKCNLFWFDIILSELLTKERETKNINDTGNMVNISLNTARNDCMPNCKVTDACEMVVCDSCDN